MCLILPLGLLLNFLFFRSISILIPWAQDDFFPIYLLLVKVPNGNEVNEIVFPCIQLPLTVETKQEIDGVLFEISGKVIAFFFLVLVLGKTYPVCVYFYKY